MIDEKLKLNQVLRPVAQPRVLEGVYTDDQYERIMGVIQRNGPWPTITAHHFNTVEELMATSNGGATGVLNLTLDDLATAHFNTVEELMATSNGGATGVRNLTLDDLATAHFRGILGESSISYFQEITDCYYSSQFQQLAREYWGALYVRPTLMLFNLCGPHHSGLNAHLDAVSFRGIRIETSPVWLQNVMGRSGLFTEHLVKMAQVITWWYRGENGTFTYWPEGPLCPPQRLEHPLWNKGVLVQNEMMFHRGDPVGRPDERDVPGLKHRSLIGYDAGRDDWSITTDGEVIRRYHPHEMRLLVHWSAEVYADRDEVKKNMDHSDDLTHDVVFERLLADMKARGVKVSEPSDPLHDQEFIRALTATYSIAPTTDWATSAA